jgi:hypothetical protein
MSAKRDHLQASVKDNKLGATRSAIVSFRAVLLAAKSKCGNNSNDKAHLERWIALADDPIWHGIVKKAFVNYPYQISSDLVEADYLWIITTGLLARRASETASKTGRDQRYEMVSAFKQKYSKLAEAAVLLAKEFGSKPSERSRRLARVLENEAIYFSDLCSKIRLPERLRISRQAGGKRRPRFRVYGVFMSYVISVLRENFGTPNYAAVVTMTNVAFPEADVTEEDARAVLRAMRGSRRRPR